MENQSAILMASYVPSKGKYGEVAQWVKKLYKNKKYTGLNTTGHLAGFSVPSLLRGSQWPFGWN